MKSGSAPAHPPLDDSAKPGLRAKLAFRFGDLVLGPVARTVWRPTVTGRDWVPKTGGVLFASNHQSFVDSVVIPLTAPRRVQFLAKSEYFTRPGVKGAISREFFTGIGALPVDRHSTRAAQESLDAALGVISAGGAFGIYPEGTRSRDGRLYRGRTGVAWLALTANVPVVPVALKGTREVQPVDAKFPKRAPVEVHFGEPIWPEKYADLPKGRARRELTDDVMAAIAAMSGQELAGAYNELPPDE